MKKNFKTYLLSVSCLTALGLMTGCNNKDDTDQPAQTQKEIVITLSEETFPLECYQKRVLGVSVEGSTQVVIFESKDESIVTVDETGLITAKDKPGQTDVVVTVEGVTATCHVVVSKSALAPSILLSKKQINLEKDTTFNVDVDVLWGTEDILDKGVLGYSILDGEDKVLVTKNEKSFAIKGIALGNAKIQVEYEGRGYLATEVIDVEVVNSSIFIKEKTGTMEFNDLGFMTEVSCIAHEGYTNYRSFSFEAYFGADKKDGTFSFRYVGDASNYISLSYPTDGMSIIGKKAGTAQIEGKFSDGNGNETAFIISVNIIKPVINKTTDLTFEVENLNTTGYKTTALELIGDAGTVSLGGKTVGSYRNNRLYFTKESLPKNASSLGDVTLQLEVENYIYNLGAKMYTMIIDSATELDKMVEIAKANSDLAQYADGYFLLGENIDYGGNTFTPMFTSDVLTSITEVGKSWYKGGVCGFRGIFDGKGYNIYNITVAPKEKADVYSGGMFGILATGGAIRNVSFYNVDVRAETAFLFTSGDGLVENVYVHYKSIGFNETGKWCNSYKDEFARNYCGTFFTHPSNDSIGPNAKVNSTVIDASKAKVYRYGLKDAAGADIDNIAVATNALNYFVPNAIVLYNPLYIRANTVSAPYKGLNIQLITGGNSEALNYVNTLSEDIWTVDTDLAVFKTLVAASASTVTLSSSTQVAHAGEEIVLSSNLPSSMLDYEVSDETVGTFVAGNFIVSDSVTQTKNVTITVRSKSDNSKYASLSVSVAKEADLGKVGKIYLNESESNNAIVYGSDNYNIDLTSKVASINNESLFEGVVINSVFTAKDSGSTYNASTHTLTINKSAIGRLYGEREIFARFNGVDYKITPTFVSKVITQANELKTFFKLSKLLEPNNTHLYGGYFELGTNIDCDYYDFDEHGSTVGSKFVFEIGNDANRKDSMGESFYWASGEGNVPVYQLDGTEGFKGVFDGCGYGINNFTIKYNWLFGGFISVMHNEGVLRNIAFTNVRLGVGTTETMPYASASIVQAGGGLVENVYVTRPFVCVTRPADGLFYNKNYIGVAAGGAGGKPTLRNVIVDDSRWNDKSYEELCPHNMTLNVTGGNAINSTPCSGIGVDGATLENVCLVTTNSSIINTFTFTEKERRPIGDNKFDCTKNELITIKDTMDLLYASFSSEFTNEWVSIWKSGSGVVLPE